MYNIELCKDRQKLAAIYVEFEDGAVWKAKK